MTFAFLFALPILASSRGEVASGVGASTNPYELPVATPAGGTAPQPGGFFPIHGFADVRNDVDTGFRYTLRGAFDADLFAFVAQDTQTTATTKAGDASHGTATVAAPLAWITGDDARRITFTVEPFAGAHRETFTSAVTGRPYAANGISYGRRFDTNHAGAKASGEVELGPRLDAYAAVGWQRVDYTEDYRSVPGVDSWDYGEFRFDADAYAYPGSGVIALSYSFRRRAHDDRFPHDASGNAVMPGTSGYQPQLFYFHNVTAKGGIERSWGRATLRGDLERRVDAFGGYLDYTDAGLSLDLRAERGDWTLAAEPGVSVRVYDHAHVNYDPIEPTNHRTRFDVAGTIERRISPTLALWFQAGWTGQRASNPLYTFDATRLSSGFRISWK